MLDRLLIPNRAAVPPPAAMAAIRAGSRRYIRRERRGLAAHRRERLGEIFEPGSASPHSAPSPADSADLLGEDVEMYQRDRRRGQAITLGRDFAELAATTRRQSEASISSLASRIAAEEPDRKRMRAGDAALPLIVWRPGIDCASARRQRLVPRRE